jgi:hypothetical protein
LTKRHDPPCESEHDFVLVLDGIREVTSKVEDALFAAGCDDATISVRSGRVFLAFTRSAPSIGQAIVGAIRDVRKAGLGSAGRGVVWLGLLS